MFVMPFSVSIAVPLKGNTHSNTDIAHLNVTHES